jgi:hypothetical protein
VFAPVYLQFTIQDVLEAWRTYLRKYNHGRARPRGAVHQPRRAGRRRRTPWATFPKGVTGRCSRASGATVLRVTAQSRGFEPPALRDATWGLHLVDANVALGNLADLVRHQISLYERR